MDSIVECSFSSNLDVTVAAVQCSDALLASMTTLIEEQGQFLCPSIVDQYNKKFRTLKQSDVAGMYVLHIGRGWFSILKNLGGMVAKNDIWGSIFQYKFSKFLYTLLIETVINTTSIFVSGPTLNNQGKFVKKFFCGKK